jgi:hypothetical protein
VYLIPPASWKSARSAAHIEAMDWSKIALAPTQWAGKTLPAPVPTVAVRPERLAELPTSSFDRLHTTTLAALNQLDFIRVTSRWRAAAARWLTSHPIDRRRTLAAGYCCAAFAATATLLGMGIAHSQPKAEKYFAAATPLAWQQPVAIAAEPVVAPAPAPVTEEIASTPAQPHSSPDVSVDTSTPSTLLSDVSTMDLMMPIAEPDLDIASQQSLWVQVGKASGVDPLLLYSVALVESRSLLPGGEVAPTPWLFRVNDHLILGERHHVQLEMAVASQLGSVVQDVGIMQVYYPMHRDAVRDPLTLLDPRTNISVAAKILRDGMHETRDPVLGVGYYHSHTPDLARNYGEAVMTVYQRLKTIYRPGRATRVVAR